MKLLIAAVGTRMAGWVDDAFQDYAKRFPRDMSLELIEVRAEPRTTGKTVDAMMDLEAQRLRAAVPARARLVVLDERGEDITTRKLAEKLGRWQAEGDDVAFVIGGPDGLAAALKSSARESLRLSSLTLPHGMVRVMLAEALYRAWSLSSNHPYHRE